jgi:hypothetical protein
MRELYIEQIASLTRTRATSVDAFAKEHNLTDSELSNLMTGLGRKMISQSDFVTALVGNKNNPIQKEVVAFAKSDKAYKMADGGSFAPNVEDGTQFMNGVYAKGGGVDYYEQLAVYVQGVGSIYNGTSMKKALEKANAYLKNNPKAEIAIVDEKYGDEYDINGNMKEEYANGGSFAPNVEDGTQFMSGVYADGGSLKKDWWHTVVNPNKDFNNFDDKMPIDWEVDDFKSWVVSNADLDGNVDKQVLDVVKIPQSKLLVEYLNKNGSGKNNDEYYKKYGNWQSALYDIFTQMKNDYLAGKSTASSKPKKYVDHDDIKSVTLNVNGNFVTFAGKDFLNGANLMAKGGDLSKIATYFPIRDIVKVTLKNGDTVKPLNGYWLKKGSEPIKKMETNGADKDFKIGDYVKKTEIQGSITYGTQGFI